MLGCAAAIAAPALAACSVTMPMHSMVPASDDVTGALATVPFGQLLDEEDRRREKAALATALDPQGDGATIHWENPKTAHTGSITPVGHAYPDDTKVCRAFRAELAHAGDQKAITGTACIITAGEWAVRDSKPADKS
jgi:surface antigen